MSDKTNFRTTKLKVNFKGFLLIIGQKFTYKMVKAPYINYPMNAVFERGNFY